MIIYLYNKISFYMANLFKINGYGNLENITRKDLEMLKEDLINCINDKLESEEN